MDAAAQAQFITKDMTIGTVVDKYPFVAETLQGFGLHCIGCHVNPYESLEGGARGHGMSDEEIGRMITEVNEIVAKAQAGGPAENGHEDHADLPELAVTPLAIQKLQEILKAQGRENSGIRVQVVAGGCAGQMYNMDFVEKPGPEDMMKIMNGLSVVVDRKSWELLHGVKMDYLEGLQGSGFKFSNPHAKATCGCGKSFK